MKDLRNKISKEKLLERKAAETIKRRTISFYKYARIENPKEFRDNLFENLEKLGVLGRIYVAFEGINAQVSVPEENFEKFRNFLDEFPFLENVRLNQALADEENSFWKLIIRTRPKIVADGIDDENFTLENRGEYLKPEEFNRLTENPETVVVDMRNFYEFEVGHFENAREIPADTFREQLPLAAEMLAGEKEKPIVMYCTGGIRCEKASAYLRSRGFKEVYHLEGGIIEYVREVKSKNLENKFRGKNFVFDARMSERVTEDVLSKCHQCGAPFDTHRNCANLGCHLLFIQCENCFEKFEGCCTPECLEIFKLPEAEQKEIRRRQKSLETDKNLFCNSRERRQKIKKESDT